jgi:hypothetical protein
MTHTSEDPYLPLAIVMAGLLAITSAFLILVGQTGLWLLFGEWPAFSPAHVWAWIGWQLPATGSAGVMNMVVWLFNCSLSGLLSSLGVILGAIGIKLGGDSSLPDRLASSHSGNDGSSGWDGGQAGQARR